MPKLVQERNENAAFFAAWRNQTQHGVIGIDERDLEVKEFGSGAIPPPHGKGSAFGVHLIDVCGVFVRIGPGEVWVDTGNALHGTVLPQAARRENWYVAWDYTDPDAMAEARRYEQQLGIPLQEVQAKVLGKQFHRLVMPGVHLNTTLRDVSNEVYDGQMNPGRAYAQAVENDRLRAQVEMTNKKLEEAQKAVTPQSLVEELEAMRSELAALRSKQSLDAVVRHAPAPVEPSAPVDTDPATDALLGLGKKKK